MTGTDWLILAAIFLAVILFCQTWEAIFDPIPTSIHKARLGTMLVYYEQHDGSMRVRREYCDDIDPYYIEEMASDRLAERHCVKVELRAVDREVYSFTKLSIRQRGW